MGIKTFWAAAAVAVSAGSVAIGPASADEYAVRLGDTKIQVNVTCENGDATFSVLNLGQPWPKTGTFRIYRAADQRVISQRRMRLAANQSARFKVRRANSKGELALFVEPSWIDRPFEFDAKANCG